MTSNEAFTTLGENLESTALPALKTLLNEMAGETLPKKAVEEEYITRILELADQSTDQFDKAAAFFSEEATETQTDSTSNGAEESKEKKIRQYPREGSAGFLQCKMIEDQVAAGEWDPEDIISTTQNHFEGSKVNDASIAYYKTLLKNLHKAGDAKGLDIPSGMKSKGKVKEVEAASA